MSETDVDAADNVEMLRSLWKPHPGQAIVMNHGARFRVVACGRRWGKSEMAAHLALEYALEESGATVWWVAPSYDQANAYGFDKITPLASPDVLVDVTRTKPRALEFDNGSTISFRSAEREDSLRGPGLDFLVIDEAGSVPERAWTEELRPALSDTLGDAVMIGTPRGRNWFYRWFQRGQSPDHEDVASWQAPTSQNPHVPDSEIDDAREDIPERKFDQEYGAKFVDDTGGVFEDVRDHVEEHELPVDPVGGQAYAIGVDLARLEDYTAIVVLDGDARLVAFDRLNETTWHRIQSRIESLVESYTPAILAVDATRDNKIVQDLQRAGMSVEPINFGRKKEVLIDNLAVRLQGGELTLSTDAPTLINELEVYEYETTAAGSIRYTAPSGFKDDTVDALALASHVFPKVQAHAARQQRSRGEDGEVDTGVSYL
jgi:phage terminase large subunit-like protein